MAHMISDRGHARAEGLRQIRQIGRKEHGRPPRPWWRGALHDEGWSGKRGRDGGCASRIRCLNVLPRLWRVSGMLSAAWCETCRYVLSLLSSSSCKSPAQRFVRFRRTVPRCCARPRPVGHARRGVDANTGDELVRDLCGQVLEYRPHSVQFTFNAAASETMNTMEKSSKDEVPVHRRPLPSAILRDPIQ